MLSEYDLKRAKKIVDEGSEVPTVCYLLSELLDEIGRLKKHCKAWNFAMDEIVSTIRMTQDIINGKSHD